jgi:hypothetical protein
VISVLRSREFGKRSRTLLSPSRLRWPISVMAETSEVAIPTSAAGKIRATTTQNRKPSPAPMTVASSRKPELRTSLSEGATVMSR